MLGGWERVTAGYLIEGPAPVLIETGSQSSVPVLLAALDQIGVGPDRAGRRRGHPHPPRPRRRGGRCRPRLPLGHRLRPREGGAAPGRPDAPHRFGRAGLRPAPRLPLRPARPDAGRAAPRAGDGEEIEVGPGADPGGGGLARTRQAPRGVARLASGVLFAGDAVGVKLPDGGVLRPSTPPPDFDLDLALTRWPSSRPGARRASRWRTTGCSSSPRNSWPRPMRPCASGPRRPRRPTARGPTSPMPCQPASTRSWRHRRGAQGEARTS
jgi:hypothetical protein